MSRHVVLMAKSDTYCIIVWEIARGNRMAACGMAVRHITSSPKLLVVGLWQAMHLTLRNPQPILCDCPCTLDSDNIDQSPVSQPSHPECCARDDQMSLIPHRRKSLITWVESLSASSRDINSLSDLVSFRAFPPIFLRYTMQCQCVPHLLWAKDCFRTLAL